MSSERKLSARNQFELMLFCVIIGAVAGALVWALLKVMAVGTELLWETLPGGRPSALYTVALCTLGALAVGLFRKKFGDYPEELDTVIKKAKIEGHYDYGNMLVMMIAALLPLLFGASVGPEAGLTGIIVGLCYWAGDNFKAAGRNAKEYSRIGAAVSLSVLFNAPLFGIFEVEEEPDENLPELGKTSMLFIYALALASGMGIYAGLSSLFGSGLSGFPSFEAEKTVMSDYYMCIPYMLCGFILALFYMGTHSAAEHVSTKLPPVLRETLAGLCLGLVGAAVPAVMFSGEEQMGVLINDYAKYLPIAMIGLAFLKILLTNLCIKFGLKGGHFFPVIFAGVCLGCGVALLVFGTGGGHIMFASAVVTATLLGAIMRRPVAVTMLLFLCFPIRMFVWIFVSAVIGSKLTELVRREKV